MKFGALACLSKFNCKNDSRDLLVKLVNWIVIYSADYLLLVLILFLLVGRRGLRYAGFNCIQAARHLRQPSSQSFWKFFKLCDHLIIEFWLRNFFSSFLDTEEGPSISGLW